MDELLLAVQRFDWSPLWISLKTGVVATVICFFLGLWLAYRVTRLPSLARSVVDGLLTLPMVVAPTVAGFFLLLIFSLKRPFGAWLYDAFDIRVVQTWLGCVIAASVIALPLMYRNARAAFEQVDGDLIDAGRTLGMSEGAIFRRVILPEAMPGVASGAVLTFARALGEYGATSMLAGNIAHKTGTISQRIALVINNGDYITAGVWVVIMLVIAFFILLAMNLISEKSVKKAHRH